MSWRGLYSFQVIKDLAVSPPHPWLQRHFEGTDRRDPLNVESHGSVSATPLVISVILLYIIYSNPTSS
jgi:hypothetical protein